MTSKLSDLSPLSVGGETLPPPQLFTNIPTLHRILEEVLDDWLRVVEPYQRQLDDSDGDVTQEYAVLSAFLDLQPLLLKCLFSYAFFFVSADDAYAYFYSQLNRVNGPPGPKLRHRNPPKQSAFINKIRLIRNIAIAHFPSKKVAPIDAYAAMSWEPMSLSWDRGGHPDLEKLTFGSGTLRGTDVTGKKVQSQDMEIPGIRTAHYEHCLPYLEEYDEVCCEYLGALQIAMG